MTSQQLYLILACMLLDAYNSVEFTSAPGVIRANNGQGVEFTWLTEPQLTPSQLRSLQDSAGLSIVTCLGTTVAGTAPDYAGRVQCSKDDSIAGFVLQRVEEAEVGNYTCHIYSPFVESSEAVLYIFKTPSVPLLAASPSGVEEAGTVTLRCTTVAASVPAIYRDDMTFKWSRNDIEFASLDRHTIANATLTITNVERDDRFNSYSCQAQEKGSTLQSGSSTSLAFDVFFAPLGASVTKQPHGPVNQSHPITVTCLLQDPGNPTAQFDWYKDNDLKTSNINPLIIAAATVDSHDGGWQCSANNGHSPKATAEFDITIYAPPSLTSNLQDKTIVNTVPSIGVTCGFESKPSATIYWHYNNGQQLPSSITDTPKTTPGVGAGGKYTRTENTLEWTTGLGPDSRRGASGNYKCVATNEAGSEQSSMYLDVQYYPYNIALDTTFTTKTEGDDGTTLSTCAATGNPVCVYTWYNGSVEAGNEVRPCGEGGSICADGGSLKANTFSRYDAGEYICKATNDVGSETTVDVGNFRLTIQYPSSVSTLETFPQDPMDGELTSLRCSIDSVPQSSIKMYNDTRDSPLTVTDVSSNVAESDLGQVTCFRSGDYLCVANNGIGTESQQIISLDVKCPPSWFDLHPSSARIGAATGSDAMFIFSIKSNPLPNDSDWSWNFADMNGSAGVQPSNANLSLALVSDNTVNALFTIVSIQLGHFGTYSFITKNVHGNWDDKPLVLEILSEGPPTLVPSVAISRVTAVSVALFWETPAFDGGMPPITYWIYYTAVWGNQTMVIRDVPGTTFKIEDEIEPEITYRFFIEAHNSKGAAEKNATTTITTLVRAQFEVAPTIELDTNVNLAYLYDMKISGPITSLIVKCCVNSDLCTITNITDFDVNPITVETPEGTSFAFSYHFYDGDDLVYEQQLSEPITENLEKPPELPVGAIVAGIVAGILALVGIILVVLVRRGSISLKGKGKASTDASGAANKANSIVMSSAEGDEFVVNPMEAMVEPTPAIAVYENIAVDSVGVTSGANDNTPNSINPYEELHLHPTYEQLDLSSQMAIKPNTEYEALPLQPLNIPAADIKLQPVVHKGTMFTFTTATYKEMSVIVKRLTGEGRIETKFKDCLAAEVKALRLAGRNENIITIIGTTRIADRDCLVLPLMEGGDLHAYLIRNKYSPDYANTGDIPVLKQRAALALDVAKGMRYLHSRQPSLLHPCLSTHKVLLDHNQVCKITGFLTGIDVLSHLRLQKEIGEFPVRWLAPEVLRDPALHTDTSDVWSYGVLLWELYTLGETPYEGMSSIDVVNYVRKGQTLAQPASCDDEIFDMMLRCWMRTPKNRVNFAGLERFLEQ